LNGKWIELKVIVVYFVASKYCS